MQPTLRKKQLHTRSFTHTHTHNTKIFFLKPDTYIQNKLSSYLEPHGCAANIRMKQKQDGGPRKWFFLSYHQGLQYACPNHREETSPLWWPAWRNAVPSCTWVLRDGRLEVLGKEPKPLIFIQTFVELLRVSTSKLKELLSMNIKTYFYLFSQSPLITLWSLQLSNDTVQWTPVQTLIAHESTIPVYFYPTCINSNWNNLLIA